MAEYVVIGRIERVQPRLVAGARRPATGDASVVGSAGARPEGPRHAQPGDSLADRWASFRDAWSQTTFFLTDPNSWR